MHWLRTGMADGSIRTNGRRALVHGVPEGMLLVSPRIFAEYLKGRATPPGANSVPMDAIRALQRELWQADWHVRAGPGVNILGYQVIVDGRVCSHLSGVVIRDPAQRVDAPPPVNPVLKRSDTLPKAQR